MHTPGAEREPAVEADRTAELRNRCRHAPGQPATEAEANRERRAGAAPGEVVDRAADVGGDSLRVDQWHVGLVVEVLAAVARTSRAVEVVQRKRFVPGLGEADRK